MTEGRVMEKYEELGKIILDSIPDEKPMKFGKITPSCPAFETKMVFMDENKKKEWDELDPKLKKSIISNLKQTTSHMEQTLSIEFLCLVIQDMMNRIEKIEALHNVHY